MVYLLIGRTMDIGKPRVADAALYRRGEAITGWARVLSVGLALVGLCLIWGNPRTRQVPALINGSAYVVFGQRAAAAALEETAAAPPTPPSWRFEPPTEATREAVWRLAGPLRDGDRLGDLAADPYPLAAAIATCAGERRESRGGHLRTDFPDTDSELDRAHIVLGPDGETRRESW